MRTVAYCRVSTNKDEQLDSLESQQTFFTQYSIKNNYDLVKIYADEGKSGTKMKNRTELLNLLSDAENNKFDIVLIKDVSRLARNTVDFLTSIRKLKTLNIKVVFVNYDQTTSESSEFMLTLLSAMAQEESANTSKRIKFGKKINMEKGKVPNLVYGYNKTDGECFSLEINETESEIVKLIFSLYNSGYGANKIATTLSDKGILTKRGFKFSQNAVSRILSNEIYIGNIINGKEEIKDFLTGERSKVNENAWLINKNESLRIIDDETFFTAKKNKEHRTKKYNITSERNSQKYPFSKLIKCNCCGYSFRRNVRKYKNTYIKWVCTSRNKNGINSCENKTTIDENELTSHIIKYFETLIDENNKLVLDLVKSTKSKNDLTNVKQTEKQLQAKLLKLTKDKNKYIDMFRNDIININDLKQHTEITDTEINNIEKTLLSIKNTPLSNSPKTIINNLKKSLNEINLDNIILSKLITNIEVTENNEILINFTD